jgi:anthranilate phosphoribosyltransferase
VLDDQPGPARDIVVANAAAALWVVGRDNSTRRCAQIAHAAIQSGAAKGLLARLVERTSRAS